MATNGNLAAIGNQYSVRGFSLANGKESNHWYHWHPSVGTVCKSPNAPIVLRGPDREYDGYKNNSLTCKEKNLSSILQDTPLHSHSTNDDKISKDVQDDGIINESLHIYLFNDSLRVEQERLKK